MQAIRLKIYQSKAHYGRPECVDNKMTYPLPTYSTIVGALHNACGYETYQPMQISVQGNYQALETELYVNYVKLNSLQDDRNRLVRLNHPDKLSSGYQEVAVALNPQGNSFKKNITISISNPSLYQLYIKLKNEEDELKIYNNQILKPALNQLKAELGQLQNQDKTEQINQSIELLKQKKDLLKQQYNDKKRYLTFELSHFATITKSVKKYEVLHDINLIIHIAADEKILSDIESNINNLTAIGRGEDFIDLIEIKRVELNAEINDSIEDRQHIMYVNRQLIVDEQVIFIGGAKKSKSIPSIGTVYYIGKDYQIIDNKRVFNKVPVCAISGYSVDDESEGLYIDDEKYIVCLN